MRRCNQKEYENERVNRAISVKYGHRWREETDPFSLPSQISLILFLCLFLSLSSCCLSGTQLMNIVARYLRSQYCRISSYKEEKKMRSRERQTQGERMIYLTKNADKQQQFYVDTQLTYNHRKKMRKAVTKQRPLLSVIEDLLYFYFLFILLQTKTEKKETKEIASLPVIICQIRFHTRHQKVVYPLRYIQCLHSFRNTHEAIVQAPSLLNQK